LSPPAQVAVRSRPRDWVNNAIRLIEADAHRSADTHLLRYPLPSAWSDNAGIELYLKDETTHITGSLKHRLARSLFLYALRNGWVSEDTTWLRRRRDRRQCRRRTSPHYWASRSSL
jgi:cysteine synthase